MLRLAHPKAAFLLIVQIDFSKGGTSAGNKAVHEAFVAKEQCSSGRIAVRHCNPRMGSQLHIDTGNSVAL